MRKCLYYFIIFCSIFFYSNVYACGEITEVTSSIGTITKKDDTHYIISIPNGTTKITLKANTLYDWVDGYAPREVSTNNQVELRVDGNKCGYGIYTYFFEFETIKENTNTNPDSNINDNNIDNSQNENSSNPENNVSNENNQNTENQENTTDTNETNISNTLYLKELAIEGLNFSFDKTIFNYNLEVDESVEKVILNAIPETEGAKVEVVGNIDNLMFGENEISINLSDSSLKLGTYKIVINRTKALSTNNYLANIKIQNHTLNFDPTINNYNLTIANEKFLNITATPESEKATVEVIGNNNLKDGSTITIRVKAENGTMKDYIIKINKNVDYTMYYIYGGAGILLTLIIILVIIIVKKNKKKRTNGNNLKEASINTQTAGEVRTNTTFDDVNPLVMEQSINQNMTNSNQNSGLKFLEPSYLENSNSNPKVYENESKTEIFKL